jgi:hypothetical protein
MVEGYLLFIENLFHRVDKTGWKLQSFVGPLVRQGQKRHR